MALLLVSINSFAQNSVPPVNSPIPPSPTSATFRQFAGYTPNLATGTVNVPIELYNLRVGDYTLPLTMQYYTQGIKVTDNPYPLGYGWILSPGLRITRTIMGRPDMYFTQDVQTSPTNAEDYGKRALYDEDSNAHSGWTYDMLRDTQHDLFTLHLPSGDYTFLLNASGNSYTAVSCNNLLKIEVVSKFAFKVTDEQGVVYHFGNDSSNSNEYVEYYPCGYSYATSWMLRKIVLPGTGREIDFTWQEVRHATLGVGNLPAGDVLNDYKENLGTVPNDPTPTYTSANESGQVDDYGNYNEVLQLKQVVFPGGKIDLTYQATQNPLLSKISVSNMFGTTVRAIDFTYGTGTSQALLLSASFSDIGSYSFTYNSGRFTNNCAQDWWGYYNGKSNTSLVPQMSIKTYNNAIVGGATSYLAYGSADRSISTTAMQANMLTKVTYPTGGYTAFEYEPHKFSGIAPTTTGLNSSSRIQLTQGGGLRVTKVTSSAGGAAPAVVKSYKYGTGENGLANVLHIPTVDTFLDELNGFSAEVSGTATMTGYNHRNLRINTHSNYLRYALNTPALWYSSVNEYVEGAGKTVYTFQRIVPENVTADATPLRDFAYKMPVAYNTLFSKGCLLTNQTDYKLNGSTYTAVKAVAYSYSVITESSKQISNAFVSRAGRSLLSNGPDLLYGSNGHPQVGAYTVMGNQPKTPYLINPLTIRFHYEQLNSVTTTHYTTQGNVTETVSYTYAGYLPRSKSITGSDGKSTSEQYFYPKDYANTTAGASSAQQGILQSMLAKNIQLPAFKTILTRNGSSQVSRTEFAYYHNSFYKPSKTYFQEVCKAEYDYDVAANIRSITENSTLKQALLWGYNYTQPVLKVEGLNYTEMANYVGSTYIANVNGTTASSISTAITNAKNAVNSYGLATAYTHQPLIGCLTETEANANKTSFAYDTAGRLTSVKDNSAYTTKSYEYNLLNGNSSGGSSGGETTTQTIQFTNVSSGYGTASASINCTTASSVTFSLAMTGGSESDYAEFILNGNYYQVYSNGGENVTLSLPAGESLFSINIFSESGGCNASIYISSVGTGNVGSTRTLQTSN